MPIDLQSELRAALHEFQPDLDALVRRAVREELPRLQRAGDPDELLDARQAAHLLNMTPAALRRAAERGRFPVAPVRLGRRLRWRRGDLLALHSLRRTEDNLR